MSCPNCGPDAEPRKELTPEIEAAYSFVDEMIKRPGTLFQPGPIPYWHGWALRDAFQAGIEWERARKAEELKR